VNKDPDDDDDEYIEDPADGDFYDGQGNSVPDDENEELRMRIRNAKTAGHVNHRWSDDAPLFKDENGKWQGPKRCDR